MPKPADPIKLSSAANVPHESGEGCLDCPHPDYCAGMGKCEIGAAKLAARSAAQGQDGFYAPAGDPHGVGDIRCLLCGEHLEFDSCAHWHPAEDKVLARSEWWDKRP